MIPPVRGGWVDGRKGGVGEAFGKNHNNQVVLGVPERFARRRAPRTRHVKTLTPTPIEGNSAVGIILDLLRLVTH